MTIDGLPFGSHRSQGARPTPATSPDACNFVAAAAPATVVRHSMLSSSLHTDSTSHKEPKTHAHPTRRKQMQQHVPTPGIAICTPQHVHGVAQPKTIGPHQGNRGHSPATNAASSQTPPEHRQHSAHTSCGNSVAHPGARRTLLAFIHYAVEPRQTSSMRTKHETLSATSENPVL